MSTHIVIEIKKDKSVTVYVGQSESAGKFLDSIKYRLEPESELRFSECPPDKFYGVDIKLETK